MQFSEPPAIGDLPPSSESDSVRGSPPSQPRSMQVNTPLPFSAPPSTPFRSQGHTDESGADSSPPVLRPVYPPIPPTTVSGQPPLPARDDAPSRTDTSSNSTPTGTTPGTPGTNEGEEIPSGKKKDKKEKKNEAKEAKKEKKQKEKKQKNKDKESKDQPAPDPGMAEAPEAATPEAENDKKGKKKYKSIFGAKGSRKLGTEEESRTRTSSFGIRKTPKKSKPAEAEATTATPDVADGAESSLQQDWEQRTWMEGVSADMLRIATFLNYFELATRTKLSELNFKLDRLERILDELEGRFYTFEQIDKKM